MEVVAATVPNANKHRPVPKRINFTWSEGREFTLVNIIFKEKGHLRTDMNLADKFIIICSKFLRDQSLPQGLSIDGVSLKKKWDRISSAVEVKYSLSEEGSNLSGLEEAASETDKLIICMLRERFELSRLKDEQKAKDSERNEKMLTHEKFVLGRQVKRESQDEKVKIRHDRDEVQDLSLNDPLEVGLDGSTRKKIKGVSMNTCSPQVYDFEVEILNALKSDPRLVDIEIEERKQKIQIAAEDRAHSRAIELRTLARDEERAKADFAAAASQKLLMEFISKNLLNK